MAALNPLQRREVVGLILSLTSNGNTNPGDLTPIYERLSAVEASVETLRASLADLSTSLSDLSIDLQDTIRALGEVSATLSDFNISLHALKSEVTSLTASVASLDTITSKQGVQLSSLKQDMVSALTDISNLKNDVSMSALNITDLQSRVTKLEEGGGVSISVDPPLQLKENNLSLNMDPYFCSQDQYLTSYSASALLMQFQWLARGVDGSSGAITMLVNAHSHGRRTDYMMSSTDPLTVTGNSVSLAFNLDYITSPPSDLSRLIPNSGFQSASFPVDVSFTRDTTSQAYQVYGTFTNPRVFKIQFLTGGTGTANLRFLTIRTGIDT